jgi:membrane-associated protease RseP (regulator of RpoE activity)
VAGWIVAVFWLVYGLTQSTIVAPQAFGPGEMAFSMDGESILMKFLTLNIIGPAPAEYFYRLTEAAFAGWVGLLVTAINLLPIGQLDGGHILYGLTRRRQHILGMIAMGGLVILGFQSSVWWVFAVFGLIFGVKHPPTLDDTRHPSRASLTMAVAAIIIMFLSFTPVPFR